jgi:hypothetical protein
MSMTTPAWLARRDGNLKLGSDGSTWFVVMGQQPSYSLRPVPVEGKFGCAIRQTINGRRIASGGTFPSQEEAIRGGLEDLRKELGWGDVATR